MSTGKEAPVRLSNPTEFNSMANDIRASMQGYTTAFFVFGVTTGGWRLVDGTPPFEQGQHRFIFRHPLDDETGVAEYACVLLSDDGYETEVCQYILVQNDNDYKGAGFERFDEFRLAPVR